MTGFTFNKALGAAVSSGLLATFLPALLGVLHMIEPVAAGVNPLLGLFVGALAGVITFFTPKNASKTG